MNRMSTDSVVIFNTARVRRIIIHACIAKNFNFLCLCHDHVNYSNFYDIIMTCTCNLFKK